MFCIKCGKQVSDDALFCTGCGAPLKTIKSLEGSREVTKGDQLSESSFIGKNTDKEGQTNRSNSVRIVVLSAIVLAAIAAIAVCGVLVISRRNNTNSSAEAGSNLSMETEVAKENRPLSEEELELDTDSIEQIADEQMDKDTTSGDAVSENKTLTVRKAGEVIVMDSSNSKDSDELSDGEHQMESQSSEDGMSVDDYIIPNSSTQLLSFSDLKGLSEEECRLARNEIYARHGRKFSDEELQAYFNSKDWYQGTIEPDDFKESMLNEIETANRDTIVEYERKSGYR